MTFADLESSSNAFVSQIMSPAVQAGDLTSSSVAVPRKERAEGRTADVQQSFVLLAETLYCLPALIVMYCWQDYHEMGTAWSGKRLHVRGSIGMVVKTSARSGKYRRGRESVGMIEKALTWSGKRRHLRGSIGMVGKTSE